MEIYVTTNPPRPLTEKDALDAQEARVPWLCECGQGDPPEHIICSACGADWDDCECGAADGSDVPWMLADAGYQPQVIDDPNA